jgi:hypothetical protein
MDNSTPKQTTPIPPQALSGRQPARPVPPKTPQAVVATQDLFAWVVIKLAKFPREHRYMLGQQIEALMLVVLEELLLAEFSDKTDKMQHLQIANSKLDLLRHLWKVARKVGCINDAALNHGLGMMVDIGRQIGGWRKSSAHPGA